MLAVAIGWAVGFGCVPSNQYESPPDPVVIVGVPLQQSVTEYFEETGTVEAIEIVDIRARVRGFLKEVVFTQGSDVKTGDVLYRIEPEEYDAALKAAEADLAAKKVELERARIEYERQQALFERKATSEQNVVAAKAEHDSAEAAVDASDAQLAQAKLNLQYTEIKSPIDGRIGRTLVTVGNLVDGAEGTHLTTVISYDPIYVRFYIQDKQLLRLIEDKIKRETADSEGSTRPLYVRREIDEEFRFEGRLNYFDLALDETAGTFLMRGEFDNPDRRLVPNNFVYVRIPVEEPQDALLIPEEAVLSDLTGRYVWVVNKDNVVERRNVTVGTEQGLLIVVRTGLQLGDRVVIEGSQRVREGAQVEPQEEDLLQFIRERTGEPEASADDSSPTGPEAPPSPEESPPGGDVSPAAAN
jgi:RND family efflux transporter MFP subunit